MHLGTNNPEHYYVLNDHVLEKSEQEKGLGVIIDRSLKKAMIRPRLEYGNAIWGPNYLGDIKMLEKIQRRSRWSQGNDTDQT